MDLIDRAELIKQAVVKFYTTNYYKHIMDMIDDAPTVDAIPLSVIEEIKAEILYNGLTLSMVTDKVSASHYNKGLSRALKIIDEKVKEYTDDM